MQLKLCTFYTEVDGKKNNSNMAVMEVNLPSGFTFDRDDDMTPVDEVDRVKRYDLEDGDSRLNIFFSSLNSVSRCVKLTASRVFKVADPAPAYVHVYDYYDTTKKALAFYTPPGFPACDICEDEEVCMSVSSCMPGK
jgi:CD109 antigen